MDETRLRSGRAQIPRYPSRADTAQRLTEGISNEGQISAVGYAMRRHIRKGEWPMKKTLSMALALVLTACLFAFAPASASAAFTDANSITYKEAVDVISALGIVNGYSDGSFRPAGALSRGAAAKIICCMSLTPEVANNMNNSASTRFKDVPAGHTFAGFINWCVQQGIVSGYSDGTFHPSDTIASQAFLKMLLCALGYDQELEHYTGGGWSNNVITRALQIGLNKGLVSTLNGSAAVNRQDACLFAFNALKADLVEYSGTQNNRAERTTTASRGTNIVAEESSPYTLQFAEQYFSDLKQTVNTTDAFGCPATKWTLKNSDVGSYLAAVDKVYYNEDVTAGTVYSDLGLTLNAPLTFYVNGVNVTKDGATISKSSEAKLSSLITQSNAIGNGVEIRAFRTTKDNAPAVTLSAVIYYPGTIASVQSATSARNRYVTIGGVGDTRAPAGLDGHNQYETDDFENGEIVAYTYSGMSGSEGVQDVIPLDPVRGPLDRIKSGSSLTVDGDEYENALNVVYNNAEGTESSLTVGNSYTVYLFTLDEKDMVMWVENVKASSDSYAWVKDISNGRQNFDYAQASLVFANGTEQVVRLNVYEAPDAWKQQIVTYSVDSANRYALTPVDTTTQENVTLRNRTGLSVAATNGTIFIVQDSASNSFKTYEGMRNMPNVKGDNAYIHTDDGAAVVVFVTNATITTSKSDLIFIAANSATNPIVEKSSTYRTFNAVVNGQITKVNVLVGTTLGNSAEDAAPGTRLVVANDSVKPGADNSIVLDNTEYDANNFVIAGSYDSNTVSASRAEGLAAPSNGAIRLGGALMDLSSNVNVYSVSTTGSISKISLTNVKADSNDLVYYTQDNRDITNMFILRVD